MSRQTIRQRDITQALREKHGGILRAVGRNSILVQLLNSMSLPSGRQQFLREQLDRMAGTGDLVIEVDGIIYTLIALPDALKEASESTDEGEEEMPERRGQHRTCQPTDGQGRQLPARLRDTDVTPVVTTYTDPEIADAVETVSQLVVDELVKAGKPRMGREEVLVIIQAVLTSLYGEEKLAGLLRDPVFGNLVDTKRLRRVEIGKVRRGQPEAVVYDITLPKAEPLTKDEAIAKLVERAEEQNALLAAKDQELSEKNGQLSVKDEEIARLRTENDDLRRKAEGVIDAETLAKLVTNLEDANTTIERLRREMAEAETAKEKLIETHKGEIKRQADNHQRQLARLQRELAEANSAKERVETELAAARTNGRVPEDMQARLKKLIG